MRHIFAGGLPGAVPGLARGMVDPARPPVLIPLAGGVEGGAPGALGAGRTTVPLAAITEPAEEEDAATVRSCADDKA